jgi:hypothetical protein
MRSRVAPARALAGEEDREQDDRAEVRDRPRRDHELPERRRALARVLEDRDQHTERRRGERDRDQQWGIDEAAGLQRARDDERDRERERVAEGGEPQHPPAQPGEVDFQAGEEEQEGEAERGDDGDRLIDVHPAEHARADDDADHDLQHDRREPESREEAECKRRAERDRGEDQQAGEGGHGRWSVMSVGRYA